MAKYTNDMNQDTLEQRVTKIEKTIEVILGKVNLDDKPVSMPSKINYNPDFLPSGPKRMSMVDLHKVNPENQ